MKLNGRVLWSSTSNRIPDALVSVSNIETGADLPVIRSDEDGDFEIELDDGKWRVSILHDDGRQIRPKDLTVPDDLKAQPDKKIEFRVVSFTRSLSQGVGTVFFAGLIALLFAVIGGWVWMHKAYPNAPPPSIASNLLNLSAEARLISLEASSPVGNDALSKITDRFKQQLASNTASGKLKKQLDDLLEHVTDIELSLLTQTERAERAIQDLKVDLAKADVALQTSLDPAVDAAQNSLKNGTAPHESTAMATLFQKLEAGPDGEGSLKSIHLQKLKGLAAPPENVDSKQQQKEFEDKLEAFEKKLPGLAQAEFSASPGQSNAFIWSSSPKIYIEILFWALIGTLVRQIFIIHQYLRWNRFIKQGIYQHIALMVTVPILTLVFVSVISMAKLTASDSSVVLDFSDPRIIAGGSFLIALVPWNLWERLLGTARKVVKSKDEDD